MQKCLTLWALILCSPLASLHAQHSVKHSLYYATSGDELIPVDCVTRAFNELVAWTPAPRPGRVTPAQSQKARSGSETSKDVSAGASASIVGQVVCST